MATAKYLAGLLGLAFLALFFEPATLLWGRVEPDWESFTAVYSDSDADASFEGLILFDVPLAVALAAYAADPSSQTGTGDIYTGVVGTQWQRLGSGEFLVDFLTANYATVTLAPDWTCFPCGTPEVTVDMNCLLQDCSPPSNCTGALGVTGVTVSCPAPIDACYTGKFCDRFPGRVVGVAFSRPPCNCTGPMLDPCQRQLGVQPSLVLTAGPVCQCNYIVLSVPATRNWAVVATALALLLLLTLGLRRRAEILR